MASFKVNLGLLLRQRQEEPGILQGNLETTTVTSRSTWHPSQDKTFEITLATSSDLASLGAQVRLKIFLEF